MEEWKEIPGFSSRNGKFYIRKDGVAKNGKGSILSVRPHYKGYQMIRLTRDHKPVNLMIHRAVCLSWLPNPENKPQINHKNGIKTDNRLENLEWCTNRENYDHAVANGLLKYDYTKRPMPFGCFRKGKITDAQVLEIRAVKLSKNGRGGDATRKDLCEKYGVSIHVIKDIRMRRSYYHV